MALQPFGIKVSQKRNKLTTKEVISLILSILLAISTVYLGWQNNNLQEQNTRLQEKQTNYPTQAYEYTQARVAGTYVNNSTYPIIAEGSLNITFIISTPDLAKLVIEKYNFSPNTQAVGFFDYSTIDDWSVVADAHIMYSTIYINQTGITEIKVSTPIRAVFYLDPSHDYTGVVSTLDRTIVVGDLTVFATLIDMQTNEQMPFSFSTTVFADVTVTDGR
jgi:hypothetical protein